MNYPEIRIKASFLLNGKVVPLLMPELVETGRVEESSDEYINGKVVEYAKVWSNYEKIVITALCDVLDVEFKQNTIDVYVAPFKNSFSDPMVLSTKYSPDRFIEVFIHELTHRLLTDNNKLPLKGGSKILPKWKVLFGEEYSFVTLVHIPVNALLKYILLDVLNEPERLKRDIEESGRGEDYDKAWNYVNDNDYMEIIRQVSAVYSK